MGDFLTFLTLLCLFICSCIQAFIIRDRTRRIEKLEETLFYKEWLESVENGSDLIYPNEKGFWK